MIAQIEKFHDTADCTWCAKNAECVEVSFAEGFLQKAVLCWKCAQQSVRVYQSQSQKSKRSLKSSDE